MTTIRVGAGVLIVVAASGCLGDNNQPSTDQLVRVDPVSAGAACPYGGVVIQTGRDNDSDEQLDDDEITSSNYVCNGSTDVTCRDGIIHEGSVTIAAAQDFATLDGVACLNGDLIIAATDVTDIPSLASLTTVTGAVIVASNPNLVSLDGLGGLREIGLSYLVQTNAALVDIEALASVSRVPSVLLVDNDSLQDLSGLASLTDLPFVLSVINNANLLSLDGLENISIAHHSLRVRSNPRLADIDGISNFTSVPLLDISGNLELTTIDLPQLTRMDVRVVIDNNPVLHTARFASLATLGDSVALNTNPELISIEFPSLLTVNTVKITGAASLASISVPRLTYVAGNVEITNSPLLDTTDFANLTQVGGFLLLQNLPSLSDLSGFSALGTVHSTLGIINTGVVDFQGLGSLQQVAGDLKVTTNPHLIGFAGLSSMTEVGGNLTISSNAALSLPVAQAFASQLSVGGSTTIN